MSNEITLAMVEITAAERYALRHVEWAGTIDGGPLEALLSKVLNKLANYEPEPLTVSVTLPGTLAEHMQFGHGSDSLYRSLWYLVRDTVRQDTTGEEAAS